MPGVDGLTLLAQPAFPEPWLLSRGQRLGEGGMLFSRCFPESAFDSRHQPSPRLTKGHRADSACDTQHVLVPAIGF